MAHGVGCHFDLPHMAQKVADWTRREGRPRADEMAHGAVCRFELPHVAENNRRVTRVDSSLWPQRTVPKLPSGTNGCQTLKTATLNTSYFCQKRPLCQPPPSPTPPPNSHFVRKVKLRLADHEQVFRNSPVFISGTSSSDTFDTRHLLHQTTFLLNTVYNRHLLHQTPCRPDTFYTRHIFTRHLLHPTPLTPNTFYTKHLLYQTPFKPGTFYTRHLLQPTPFTPDNFFTKHSLQQAPFTPNTL